MAITYILSHPVKYPMIMPIKGIFLLLLPVFYRRNTVIKDYMFWDCSLGEKKMKKCERKDCLWYNEKCDDNCTKDTGECTMGENCPAFELDN